MRRICLFFILIVFFISCTTANNEEEKETEENIDLQEALIAHYLFDANANDSSGNNNHGTINGGAAIDVQDRYLNNNSAVSFDGVDGYINTNITNLGNVYTLSFWFKDNLFTGVEILISKQSTVTTRDSPMQVYSADSPNRLYFCAGTGDSWNGSEIFSPVENVWYHIVVKSNGSEAYEYVNGKYCKTTTFGKELIINTEPIFVGRLATDYYQGIIDDIRIYNRELSGAEIKALYNQEKP